MASERRRGFLGWLADGLKGAPRAAETHETPASPAETRDLAPPDRSDVVGDVVGDDDDDVFDEAPLFVPMARPQALPAAPPRQHAAPTFIRPPGAVVGAFENICTRCGLCVDACPEDAITVGPDGYPTLAPARNPCQLCPTVPCAAACPEGALRPVAPVDIRIGLAVLLTRLCHNTIAAESCERCFDQCPIPGAMTPADRGLPRIDPGLCTGCGLCARSCPASPGAIIIRPRSTDM